MSYRSLDVAIHDYALAARIDACAQQEARENPDVADTPYAEQIRAGSAGASSAIAWSVVIATEAEYAYALEAGHPAPIGEDEAVITDAMILSAVQANWPMPPAGPPTS